MTDFTKMVIPNISGDLAEKVEDVLKDKAITEYSAVKDAHEDLLEKDKLSSDESTQKDEHEKKRVAAVKVIAPVAYKLMNQIESDVEASLKLRAQAQSEHLKYAKSLRAPQDGYLVSATPLTEEKVDEINKKIEDSNAAVDKLLAGYSLRVYKLLDLLSRLADIDRNHTAYVKYFDAEYGNDIVQSLVTLNLLAQGQNAHGVAIELLFDTIFPAPAKGTSSLNFGSMWSSKEKEKPAEPKKDSETTEDTGVTVDGSGSDSGDPVGVDGDDSSPAGPSAS